MRKLIMIVGLILGGHMLQAQKYYAVMVLESKEGKPISGASVKIKSTGKTETTGESGNVVIFASPEDSLHIQFKGYKEREISLVNQSQAISIIMTAAPKAVVASKPKKKSNKAKL